MIDFVKFHIDKKYKANIKEKIAIVLDVNDTTGVISKQSAKYKNMMFLFWNTHIEIKGSIHKFFNDGLHNHNDFSFSDIRKAISSFCQFFNIPPNECYLKNLEVGFNIRPSVKTKDLLDSILLYQNKEPSKKIKPNMHFLEFELSRYYLKIYDKGLQFGLSENKLRVEVKFNKMIELKAVGIETLDDLFTQSNIEWLIEYLFSCFERVLMYDYTLSLEDEEYGRRAQNKEIEILRNGCNPIYWIKEKVLLKPTTFYKKLNRFKSLRNMYNQNKYHTLILSLLKEKYMELIK